MTDDVTSKRPRGLGQGLSALFDAQPSSSEGPALSGEERGGSHTDISISAIACGRFQPRLRFDETQLAELAQSISEKGVLQPLLVRRSGAGFELIAGERRLRASQMAGLSALPCRILDVSEQEAFEIALLENIQRSDLSPIEEAKGYRQLLEGYGYTQDTLSSKIGKSRSHMTNLLRLLTLPDSVQTLVDQGELTMGHGRALVGSEDPETLAYIVLEKGLSVRGTEALVRGKAWGGQGERPLKPLVAPSVGTEEIALAHHLENMTGLGVSLKTKASGGTVQFTFKTPMELDVFLESLTRGYLGSPVGLQKEGGDRTAHDMSSDF